MRARMIVGMAAVTILAGATLSAQATRQDPDVLNALLVEVRGLRAAMEQIGTAGARVQLALGRLQLQETRVNTMIQRLQSLRDDIGKKTSEIAGQQGQIAGFQKMFTDSKMPPEEPNPMAGMLEGFKKAMAAANLDLQRLQAEEAQLQQEIASEQARWGEINRTLEELERALAKR